MAQEERRIKSFIKAYGELVAEYKVDFAAVPMWIPTGNGEFKLIVRTKPVDLEAMEKERE